MKKFNAVISGVFFSVFKKEKISSMDLIRAIHTVLIKS